MNRKILIGLSLCVIVAIGIIALVILRLQTQEDVKIQWTVQWFTTDDFRSVDVLVMNRGSKAINVTRVELIYLPDETLGLIWIELRTIEAKENSEFDIVLEDVEDGEQLEFFNLLWESRFESIVKIIVETTEAIYTYYPEGVAITVEATTIERK